MRIAQAQGRQAAAELEVVRYQVKRAMLRAPFAGTVMEGRHRERLGAAVKQGELLFRVARTDRVYAEIDVDERDVQELREGARGEIAFTSRPDESFPLRVVRIEPAGTTKNAANVFVVRAELPGAARAWWRPGMTGVAKIEAGRRSYLWIATHRLVDFLRLKLWWW
jgi:multidrug resistance efflux pump